MAQERVLGGSSSQQSLSAVWLMESQSPGNAPPLVLQSGSQTVTCLWITWGSAKLKIPTHRTSWGKFLISNRLPGDVGAVGPSAALCRGQWSGKWGGVGRERGAKWRCWGLRGAVGWCLCRESGSSSLLFLFYAWKLSLEASHRLSPPFAHQ